MHPKVNALDSKRSELFTWLDNKKNDTIPGGA